jgi:hypothetical protein
MLICHTISATMFYLHDFISLILFDFYDKAIVCHGSL